MPANQTLAKPERDFKFHSDASHLSYRPERAEPGGVSRTVRASSRARLPPGRGSSCCAVPWTGFPISALIKEVDPQPKAKFMRMVTACRSDEMPGIRSQQDYPWPYFKALRPDETMNELALLVTGVYGKPLPKQNGAPIRFITP